MSPTSPISTVPYVIGQWVSGPRFYGRAELLERLSGDAPRRVWLVGLRRVGKTSLLKQLEFLALSEAMPLLPLFWDLQGVDDARELGLSLADALLEVEEPLARWRLSPAAFTGESAAACLEALAAALAERGAGLLLLVDEAEELVALERAAPGTVEGLWRALGESTRARVVLASSPRLEGRAQDDPVAAWLEPFGGPIYVGPLAPDEARALLRQDQLPAASRPGLDATAVERLRSACGDHPMLLQMLGKRGFELGDAEAALGQLESERTLDHLFSVDLELLRDDERELLRALARGAAIAADDPRARRPLALGLVRGKGATLELANLLFARWLAR